MWRQPSPEPSPETTMRTQPSPRPGARRPVRSRIHCPTGGDGRGRPLPDSRQRFGGGRGFRTAAHASRRHGSPYLRRARHRFAAVRRRPGRMLSAANLFGGTQHRFPHRPPLHRIHHRPGRPHRPGTSRRRSPTVSAKPTAPDVADSTQRQSSHVTFPTTFTPSRASCWRRRDSISAYWGRWYSKRQPKP